MWKQSDDKEAKISASDVSLKQFSKQEWKLKQDQLIEKVALIFCHLYSFSLLGFCYGPAQLSPIHC